MEGIFVFNDPISLAKPSKYEEFIYLKKNILNTMTEQNTKLGLRYSSRNYLDKKANYSCRFYFMCKKQQHNPLLLFHWFSNFCMCSYFLCKTAWPKHYVLHNFACFIAL